MPIHWSNVKPFRAESGLLHTNIFFRDADILVEEAYGGVVGDVSPVEVEIVMNCIVGDNDNWDLSNIPLSRDADVCEALPVYFKAIQS